jgi:hypothetical protein
MIDYNCSAFNNRQGLIRPPLMPGRSPGKITKTIELKMPKRAKDLIPEKRILRIILVIRGEKVILDSDLAALYGAENRRLNEQVRRNIDKFPEDFMFQLTKEEFANLKSQIAISSSGWGGRRKPPFGFTEHGTLQAANVLNSTQANKRSSPRLLFYFCLSFH